MIVPKLSVAQRSCLLRAARERLAQLHEDYEAARGMSNEAKASALDREIACVAEGISWLWRQHASDEAS